MHSREPEEATDKEPEVLWLAGQVHLKDLKPHNAMVRFFMRQLKCTSVFSGLSSPKTRVKTPVFGATTLPV